MSPRGAGRNARWAAPPAARAGGRAAIRRWACALALVAGLGLSTQPALAETGAEPATAHDMVLGRMVAARPDAPGRAVTRHAQARYQLHCAGCHGASGAGAPSAGVPDLRGMGGLLRLSGGRDFVLRVPGVMASGLDDAGVASVLNWLLDTLARDSRPPETAAFTPSEVQAARQAPLVDVMAERARLLEQARRQGIRLY